MQSGDQVWTKCQERRVRAQILMASQNEKSLLLEIETPLRIGSGVYVNFLPLLKNEKGVYRDLLTGNAFQLEQYKDKEKPCLQSKTEADG
jgi:hypothetical protein